MLVKKFRFAAGDKYVGIGKHPFRMPCRNDAQFAENLGILRKRKTWCAFQLADQRGHDVGR